MADPVGVAFFPVTPFDDESNLNERRLRDHVSSTVGRGDFSSVIPLGSVGEFPYLTVSERKRVVDVVVDEVGGDVPVLPGTSALSTREAVELSEYAEDTGADGLLVAPQSYFTPTNEGVRRHYEAIADAVDVPICAYNNPFTTNVDMDVELVESVTALDGVEYFKSGTGDLREFRTLARRLEDVSVFAAPPHMFEKLVHGARGWSGPIATLHPETALELYGLVREGDIEAARERFAAWEPLLECFRAYPFTATMKAALDLQGRSMGEPRRPIQPLGERARDEVAAGLDELGIR